MIRICHVQVLPILSGVQRVMLDIFKQLDRTRYEIHVVCKEPGPLTRDLDRDGIRTHCIASLDRPIRPSRDLRAYRELRSYFEQQQFQLVHTHSSKPGILGRLAARHAGVPAIVHHVHAFAFHEFTPRVKRWFYGKLESIAGRYCDRVLFVNGEERELAVRRGWLSADKCQTIYNGADLAEFHPGARAAARSFVEQKYKLKSDELWVTCVGRLDYPKLPLLLPEIASRLDTLLPCAKWRLLVLGSGEQEQALKQLIAQHDIGRRVVQLGWQDAPGVFINASDVVLLTSLAEGHPRALVEAQAAGVPIVASAAKGIREIVTPATGYLCAPHAAAEYAAALAELLTSYDKRISLGAAARQRAEQHFDTVKNGRAVAQVYDKLLGASIKSHGTARRSVADSRGKMPATALYSREAA